MWCSGRGSNSHGPRSPLASRASVSTGSFTTRAKLRESDSNRRPPGYEPGDLPPDLSRDELEQSRRSVPGGNRTHLASSAAGPAIGRRSQQSGRQGLNLRSLASDASAIPLRYTLMNQYPVRESNPPLRLERSTASPEARTGLQYRVRVSNPSGWVENPATSRKSNAARVRSTSGSNRADRCCRAAPSP